MGSSGPRPEAGAGEWYVVDAEGKTLGRLASQVAKVLRGKHKPTYTPHLDTGDHVIVINAEKVKVTGNKAKEKIYYRHTGWPGGLRAVPYDVMISKKPEAVIEHAVKGMLPHNRLGRALGKKLKVYRGADHPHAAQKPKPLEIAEQGDVRKAGRGQEGG
ncbi:MAG: 50S ribosomal protein L13 [Bacillota bacterium]